MTHEQPTLDATMDRPAAVGHAPAVAPRPSLPRIVWQLLRETVADWSNDRAPRLAAALSYYTLFSLAPLLIVIIAVAGLVFGQEAVRGEIFGQIDGMVGRDGARAIEELIESARKPAESIPAAIIGMLLLLLGAAGVLLQLQDALNTVWDAPPQPSAGVWGVIRTRLASFAFVLGIGFVLLVSLTVSASLAAMQRYFTTFIPGTELIWMVLHVCVSIAVVTLMFALMFKYLPDVSIAWSDVWVGAAVTAVLFTIGKYLVGLYLGRASFTSSYGAAGSLVVVLVWVYYSAQIFLLGAEFTEVYARTYGSRIGAGDRPPTMKPASP